MTQQQLIDHVMTATCLSREAATKAVQAMLQGITAALGQGEDVRLNGFGTFSVAARPAREGRNPRTGEPVIIAASRSAKFKAGKPLRDAINSAGRGRQLTLASWTGQLEMRTEQVRLTPRPFSVIQGGTKR